MRELQDGDEGVVEVRATRQLDVLDSRRQLESDLTFAIGQQGDLGPLAGRVADGDYLVDVDRRHQADDLRALWIQVRAERTTEQDLVEILRLDPEDVHQHLYARGDRALGELQLTYVSLRQEHAVREQERTNAVDVDEPIGERVTRNV